MEIVLLSDEFPEDHVQTYFPPDVKVFKVSEGSRPLLGARIHNAYIDWSCYKDPNYEECLRTIRTSISLTSRTGAMYLL